MCISYLVLTLQFRKWLQKQNNFYTKFLRNKTQSRKFNTFKKYFTLVLLFILFTKMLNFDKNIVGELYIFGWKWLCYN